MTTLSHLFNDVQWQPLTLDFTPSAGEAYATHRGLMAIDAVEVRCYRFSDGTTGLDVEDIERFLRGCPHCSNPAGCPPCSHIGPEVAEERVVVELTGE